MGNRLATEIYEQFYQDFNNLLRKPPFDNLPAIEVLAVVANHLGKLIALQDQRVYTPDQVMKIVTDNIEEGNARVIATLAQTKGNA